jgi:hypothetical protein
MSSLPVSFARFSGAILVSFMENDDVGLFMFTAPDLRRDFALCIFGMFELSAVVKYVADFRVIWQMDGLGNILSRLLGAAGWVWGFMTAFLFQC